MYTKQLALSLCITSLFGAFIFGGFTKPKIQSSNKIKEECGQLAATTLKQVPNLMHAIADVQAKTTDFLEDLLDGDSNGFCSTATRDQLELRRQRMVVFNRKMSEMEAEMKAFVKEMNHGI